MSPQVVRFVYRDTPAMVPAGTRPYVVVYDGHCKVCTRMARLLEKWDTRGRIEILPFQDASVADRFPWIPMEAYREAMQLIGPGKTTWAGSQAIDELLGILPAGWMLGWVFRIPLLGRMIDRFYRWFARNRYRLGCGEHCSYHKVAG